MDNGSSTLSLKDQAKEQHSNDFSVEAILAKPLSKRKLYHQVCLKDGYPLESFYHSVWTCNALNVPICHSQQFSWPSFFHLHNNGKTTGKRAFII